MTEVVTYRKDDQQCFCQLRFDSGERVLISIASKPSPSVKIKRLALGGLVPISTLWKYDVAMAGGAHAYATKMIAMFSDGTSVQHPLDAICDVLFKCGSIREARQILRRREARLAG
jgi:hypothetical protein